MNKKVKEQGQIIILVVVGLFSLLVMSALIIDGGNAYLLRRRAQTAADAGALAGAYEYCVNKGDAASVAAAISKFVETENGAIWTNNALFSDYYDSATKEIVVEVKFDHLPILAKLFNPNPPPVVADARAACFPPGAADSVLPIAWSCRPPLPGMESDSDDCEWKAIPWNVMQDILDEPGFVPTGEIGTVLYDSGGTDAASYLGGKDSGDLALYLVMDANPTTEDVGCEMVGGFVNCDIDGDGRDDLFAAGNRSWMILDGDANNAQLDDIIRGELEFGVSAPTWYPSREGAIADVYKDAKAFIEGKPAMIPVFEVFCSPTENPMTDPYCEPLREETDGLVQISTAASSTYFRVVSFAEFFVTCVSNKKSNACPGKQLAVEKGLIADNVLTIEGYFIDGWASTNQTIGMGTTDVDLGIYVISLTD